MYIYGIKICEYGSNKIKQNYVQFNNNNIVKLFADQYNCLTSILFKRLLKLLS